MTLHPVIDRVTDRIRARSAESRAAYLARIAAAAIWCIRRRTAPARPPTADATPGSGRGARVTVTWEVATDASFRTVVRRGSMTTGTERDHTVKVDATGLKPGTRYAYRFRSGGSVSPTGWTKTAPAAGSTPSRLRLGVVSCSNWEAGYFAAYRGLAPESRPASVEYKSTVDVSDREVIEAMMLTELAAVRQREIERGISLVGPHRDDLVLNLGHSPAKGFASHGETWSYAIALRLAEFNLLRQEGGSDPVLILDDVFAELDAKRRKQLVHLSAEAEQVLITAAVDEDLPGNLEPIVRYRVSVEDTETGRISKLSAEEGEGNE